MMAAAIIALHGASVSLNKIGPASRRQSCCAPRALPDIDNRSRRAAGRIWQRCTAGRKQIWPGAELARVCIRSLSRIRALAPLAGALRRLRIVGGVGIVFGYSRDEPASGERLQGRLQRVSNLLGIDLPVVHVERKGF